MNDLDLVVLRRQLKARKLTDVNIHNLAGSMFKPDSKVQFTVNGREYFGRVVEVIGVPGRTQVRVVNLSTKKQRDLHLVDITGLVRES